MKKKKIYKKAWFRVKTHCEMTGLTVAHPEVLRDASDGADYTLELGLLGSSILLITATGYVTARHMAAAIAFIDDYLNRNVAIKKGLVIIEDYARVDGADSEARRKYIEYNKNSGFFEGAVIYNASTLFWISLNLAKRLQIYDKNVQAVNSYQEAVTAALQILREVSDRQEAGHNPASGGGGSPIPTVGAGLPRYLSLIWRRIGAKARFILWGGYNTVSHGLMDKYTDELLKHIDAIDWQTDGIKPLESDVGVEHPFRKVYDAISFVKSEIDRLMAERVQAEQSLRDSEARYRHLVEYAKAGIVEIDFTKLQLVSVNEAVIEATGYSSEELLSMNFLDLLSGESRKTITERLKFIMDEGTVDENLECQIVDRQGKMIWALLNSHRHSENGRTNRATVVITDITQLKQTENRLLEFQGQLRSLAKELSMSEEKQRRLLATQLHDRVSQELAVANLLINSFERTLDDPGQLHQLQDIRKQIVKVIHETRSLTFDLSPPVLYDLGFEEAVEWLAEKIEENHHLQVEISSMGVNKVIGEEIGIILFRNIKELMHNTVKHAQAANIFIRMELGADALRIQVRDDGAGFDTTRLTTGGQTYQGYGLFSIREKLNHLGGALEIESAPGQGTAVTMTVPLTQPMGISAREVHELREPELGSEQPEMPK